jgi:glycerol-3-phosphate dehydrogenase (NAD(P)+)
MSLRFAVLGDGAWGTTVALLLAQNPGHRVSLWSAREDNGRILRERRENVRLLPGVPIPESIKLTMDIREAVEGADLWISAIPTVYLRSTLGPIATHLPDRKPVLSLSKGLEIHTFLRPSQILHELLGTERIAVLSGPSHAEEVSRGLPASVVVASAELELASWIQHRLTSDRFRVYTNLDVVGVELAGALKNIIGIAAGISDGLGLGDNAKAALLTRGMVEMARFGVALGAEYDTFTGLAGLGDVITTCMSIHGRNHHVGVRLGKGEKLSAILAGMTMVAEGVFTCKSVYEKSHMMGLELPITTEVYRVLYEDKAPRDAVSDLMMRQPKRETN